MRDALRRFPLERALQLAIASAIVTSVLAAGAILSWLETARKLRWTALLVVVVLALAYAYGRRGGPALWPVFAAASAFLALTVLSAGWSPVPGLTLARSAALALLFVACGALAYATAGRAEAIGDLLYGVLAGAVAVAVGGLLVLAFDYDRAVAPATTSLPARYQGLGGGPDTATMVLAVGAPLAAYAIVESRSRLGRACAVALLALLLGSIVASGSRGALTAAFAGLVAFAVLAARSSRARMLSGAGLVVLFAVAVLVMQLPKPAEGVPGRGTTQEEPVSYVSTPAPGFLDANEILRLQDDVGRPPWGVADTERRPRTLLGTSGRVEAWRGALTQAAERPLLGYGFGTEDRVFVDRYVNFNSNSIESSYIGLFLQLGLVGIATFAVLLAVLARPTAAFRRLGAREARVVGAAAGGLVVGLVLAFVQSYVYAVGNNATAAVWICAFLLAATQPLRPAPVPR